MLHSDLSTHRGLDVSKLQSPVLLLQVFLYRAFFLYRAWAAPGQQWTCMDNRSLCSSWTYVHYRDLCCTRTCLHTGAWAWPGRAYTAESWAAPGLVSSKGVWAVPRRVYTSIPMANLWLLRNDYIHYFRFIKRTTACCFCFSSSSHSSSVRVGKFCSSCLDLTKCWIT